MNEESSTDASSSTGASSSMSSPQPSPSLTKNCSHCSTPSSEEKDLKPCTKCHTALYCSRDCAKVAWKTHKKTCAKDAQVYAAAANVRVASAPRAPKREGHRGGLQKWQFDT